MQVSTIGIDLAKNVFQVHGVDAAGKVALTKKLRRAQVLALLVVGATAVLRHARARPDKHPWLMQLLARRPAKVVAVALANKMARIAWAVLARGETYRAPALAVAV